MPCSLLVAMEDIPGIDISSGMILDVRGAGDFGAKEVLPRFGRLEITNRELDQLLSRAGPWARDVGIENVTHSVAEDEYTFDLVATNAHPATFLGAISMSEARDEVEGVLNGTINSAVDRGVNVTLGMFNAMVAYIRRGRPFNGETFSDSYNQETGDHTITLDFSSTTWGLTGILKQMLKTEGVSLVSSSVANKEVVFTVNRANVLSAGREYLQSSLATGILPAKYAINAAGVAALANAGGAASVAFSAFSNYLVDLRTD